MNDILESSLIIFECFTDVNIELEFEYISEVGTGLGPTLEFYSLVVDEIVNLREKLWRKTDDNSLFPNAINPMEVNSKKT